MALLDEVEPVFGLTKSIWRKGSRYGRTKSEARAAIENVFSELLEKPLGKQNQADFSKQVREYKPRKKPTNDDKAGKTTANGAASRALAYLRTVFNWASHRGCFAKENAGREEKLDLPDLANIHDPSIDDPTLEVKRERVLDQDELVKVMPLLVFPAPPGLRSILEPTEDYGPVAFRFIFLTLSRVEEVLQARRRDFDLHAGTWTKTVKTRRRPGSHGPAGRRQVTIPLSAAAEKLLLSLPTFTGGQPDDLIFPSSNGGVLRNLGRTQESIHSASETTGWHRHDLRRTAATILRQLGVAPAIIDTLLCHLNPLNKEKVSSAATVYMLNDKILREAVDYEREAANMLGNALETICKLPSTNPVLPSETISASNPPRKASPWSVVT